MKYFTIAFSIFMAVAFAVICGALIWLEYELWALAAYAAMIIALPFSSIMHELGHMLFGAFVKIKAVPKFTVFGSSRCKLVPKTDKNLRFRLCFTTVGGLAVNFIFCIVGILPFFCEQLPYWLMVFLPASIYLFLMNCYPVVFANGKTDGLVCSDLLHNTDVGKVMLAVLTVQAQVLNGKPIEEVDEKLLFDLPQIQEDDQAFISLTELRYEYFKAKGDDDKAQLWKTRFEELKKEYL